MQWISSFFLKSWKLSHTISEKCWNFIASKMLEIKSWHLTWGGPNSNSILLEIFFQKNFHSKVQEIRNKKLFEVLKPFVCLPLTWTEFFSLQLTIVTSISSIRFKRKIWPLSHKNEIPKWLRRNQIILLPSYFPDSLTSILHYVDNWH